MPAWWPGVLSLPALPDVPCQAMSSHVLPLRAGAYRIILFCGQLPRNPYTSASSSAGACGLSGARCVLPATTAEKPPKCKREVAQPRDGFMITGVQTQTVTPIPYDIVKEGLQT